MIIRVLLALLGVAGWISGSAVIDGDGAAGAAIVAGTASLCLSIAPAPRRRSHHPDNH